MLRITELRLPLDHAEGALRSAIVSRLGLQDSDLKDFTVFKRSYDARKKTAIVLIYTLDCELASEALQAALLQRFATDPHVRPTPDTGYHFVGHAPADFHANAHADERLRPLVIGFGPCGIFAALILAQMGLRPIVLERGKEVRQRTKDTWGLWRQGVLNPESNVQFGEGGAGTFSDGKLWSQISDPRHLTRKVLTEFVKAGAPEEILYVAKPHIGTFRLVSMVEKMRAEMLELGAEIRFETRVDDGALLLTILETLGYRVWFRYQKYREDYAVGAALVGGLGLAASGNLIIFPEGTRVAVGDSKPYQVGVAALYRQLDLPVVPVALNSGLFWGRRKFVKRPGVIDMEILPAIPPGLKRDAFMTLLHERIEEATGRLVAGAETQNR